MGLKKGWIGLKNPTRKGREVLPTRAGTVHAWMEKSCAPFSRRRPLGQESTQGPLPLSYVISFCKERMGGQGIFGQFELEKTPQYVSSILLLHFSSTKITSLTALKINLKIQSSRCPVLLRGAQNSAKNALYDKLSLREILSLPYIYIPLP